MLWRAPRRSHIPHSRQRDKVNAGHTSKYASTVDTVLPLKVIATDPSGQVQEQEGAIWKRQSTDGKSRRASCSRHAVAHWINSSVC
jgi:hypothetical protein